MGAPSAIGKVGTTIGASEKILNFLSKPFIIGGISSGTSTLVGESLETMTGTNKRGIEQIGMQRRNHKRTQSLKKFTVRTITDVSIVCAVGAIFVIGAMVFALIDEPEVFKKNTFIMLILVAFLGLMFFGMIAPIKGVWDICVDENDVTVIKAFFYKRHWKISDISYCKRKRGGMNVYVNGRKKKAFFVDGMTDHFDNFIKRMEKEGKEIILPETKEKR